MLCMWTQEYFKDMPNATLEHLMSALEHGNGERKLEHIVQELDGRHQANLDRYNRR